MKSSSFDVVCTVSIKEDFDNTIFAEIDHNISIRTNK